MRTKEAINYLENEFKRKDVSNTEKPSLITAISDSVTFAKDNDQSRVRELFIDRIKLESNFQILKALANALVKFNDPSLNSYLQKIKSKIAFQEHPMIDRLIEKNKGISSNDEVKKLEERISKLEKENLDLKEKILKIQMLVDANENS